MTIVSKPFADQIIQAGGRYRNDGQVVQIIEFECSDETCYGLVYTGKRNGYTKSEVVRNPRVYWTLNFTRRV